MEFILEPLKDPTSLTDGTFRFGNVLLKTLDDHPWALVAVDFFYDINDNSLYNELFKGGITKQINITWY